MIMIYRGLPEVAAIHTHDVSPSCFTGMYCIPWHTS